jgi:hypothetical protein
MRIKIGRFAADLYPQPNVIQCLLFEIPVSVLDRYPRAKPPPEDDKPQ